MSTLVLDPPLTETTSALGPLLRHARASLAAVMPIGFGTSSEAPAGSGSYWQSDCGGQTTAGGSFTLGDSVRVAAAQVDAHVDATESQSVEPVGPAIAELRLTTGFTWEQLALLFGVSRRALHFWASGSPMNRVNEERLHRILGVIRHIDRGAAATNRAALLAPSEAGPTPFELLADKQYEQALLLLGPGPGRPARPKVSPEALAARAPQRPEELVEALQDNVHVNGGVARAAKRVKVRGGG